MTAFSWKILQAAAANTAVRRLDKQNKLDLCNVRLAHSITLPLPIQDLTTLPSNDWSQSWIFTTMALRQVSITLMFVSLA